MPHIQFAMHPVLPPHQQLHWQLTVNTAFAGGSLAAALLNLGALVAFALARSAFCTLRQRASRRGVS